MWLSLPFSNAKFGVTALPSMEPRLILLSCRIRNARVSTFHLFSLLISCICTRIHYNGWKTPPRCREKSSHEWKQQRVRKQCACSDSWLDKYVFSVCHNIRGVPDTEIRGSLLLIAADLMMTCITFLKVSLDYFFKTFERQD